MNVKNTNSYFPVFSLGKSYYTAQRIWRMSILKVLSETNLRVSFPYLDHKERREKGIDYKMNYCSFIY